MIAAAFFIVGLALGYGFHWIRSQAQRDIIMALQADNAELAIIIESKKSPWEGR